MAQRPRGSVGNHVTLQLETDPEAHDDKDDA